MSRLPTLNDIVTERKKIKVSSLTLKLKKKQETNNKFVSKTQYTNT